jgi:hypothetical protein
MRASHAGQDPGEARRVPQEQRHEYNHYMGLIFVAGCQMGALLHVIKSQVDNLEFDVDRIDLLEAAATQLEEDDPESVSARPVRPWRQRRRSKELITVPEFLRCLAAELREDAYKELSVRWQELRAVEVVLGEIAEQFDGEDALNPDMRGWLTECRTTAQTYGQRLGRKRLPEPGDDYIARTQALVDQGVAALGLTEE